MILKAGLKQGHDDQFLEQLGFMRNIKREMKAMHNLFLFYVLVECKKTKAAKENEKKSSMNSITLEACFWVVLCCRRNSV